MASGVQSRAGRPSQRTWRYVAIVAACFAVAFGLSILLDRLNDSAYDIMSARAQPDWTPQSVVAGIGEDAFEQMGGPAAIRTILARALDELREAGPKLVAVDILLHDRGKEEDDARLAEALHNTRIW